MFERYTEKARRVIFFARYEATHYASAFIETEHLLLGILREDRTLAVRFLGDAGAVTRMRPEIERQTTLRGSISASTDVPLSSESKKALLRAAEEADRLGSRHIGTEHLLLGLLCVEGSLARRQGFGGEGAQPGQGARGTVKRRPA